MLTEYGPECTNSPSGTDYYGKTSVTYTVKMCQLWLSNRPHKNKYRRGKQYPDKTLRDAANYCRNPGSSRKGPWCYTIDKDTEWEYCFIRACDSLGE